MRLSCLLVAAAAALCPQPAQAAPGHAEIAFVSDDRIWASRADGSERRLLIAPTRPRESLSQPVWSPDGSTLAYVSAVETRRDDIEAAQLMAFDGTRSHAITPLRDGVVDFSPRWSPDGTALVFSRFVSERGFPSLVLTRQLDSGAERALASARIGARLSFVGEPSWSPDGTTIAYTRSALDRQHHFRPTIRTVAAAGGASRLLIPDARSPAWSPHGRLAFASVRDRNGSRCGSHECRYAAELYTSAADGSALTRLTRTKGDESAPAWSPDGSHPVHERSQPARGRLPGGLLRRGRRQLPHVADQRHPRERARDVAARERRPLRPRQLRRELARGAGRWAEAVPDPRRPVARAQAPRTAALARRAPLPVLPRLRAVRPA